MTQEHREPWEDPNSPWRTKAAFFTWLRGRLRQAVWETYPLKISFKNSNCFPPPPDYTGRAKSGNYCSLSGAWTAKSYLEVDHIIGNASFRDWSDLESFVKHLCITTENMQLVSKESHKIKSYAEKHNMSFEKAFIVKEAIAIKNNKKDKEFFIERNLNVPSNAEKRRQEIIEILLKENNIDPKDC